MVRRTPINSVLLQRLHRHLQALTGTLQVALAIRPLGPTSAAIFGCSAATDTVLIRRSQINQAFSAKCGSTPTPERRTTAAGMETSGIRFPKQAHPCHVGER